MGPLRGREGNRKGGEEEGRDGAVKGNGTGYGVGGKGKEGEGKGKGGDGLQSETSIPGAATADLDPNFVNPGSAPGLGSPKLCDGSTLGDLT